MRSFLIFFALVALICYYGYSAFKILKNFIDKKLKQKKVASKINDLLHNVSDNEEQTNGN